jgi:OmpR-family two-component system manganese-sensing sensor histidine kinase
MLHKLKKRLIILNTIVTSTILSIVVIGACYVNIIQYKRNNIDNFINLLDSIEDKLQLENIITNTWLSQFEVSNQMIVHIEDNGSSFFFKGGWKSAVYRDIMIKEAKKAALTEEIDTTVYSLPFEKTRSSIYNFTDHRIPAYASVSIIPTDKGYMSLTLIQFRPLEKTYIRNHIFLFISADILGILALFLVSCFFVRKALKPVEENHIRQNEFIASVSHDLRSPLAVIQTNATALLIKGSDPKRFVPVITGECTRMSRMLKDMLILVSSDSKTWTIRKESIDTDTYLIELYETFSSLCYKKEHKLSLDFLEAFLPKINADKDRLTQVLGILIDNAISYSPFQSTITIRPYVKKNIFCIEVEDQGIGIEKDQIELIFNRFYRADKSRNNTSHFGLGLSVAKELMELQGGKIRLKNAGNKGSVFIIELPL